MTPREAELLAQPAHGYYLLPEHRPALEKWMC